MNCALNNQRYMNIKPVFFLITATPPLTKKQKAKKAFFLIRGKKYYVK